MRQDRERRATRSATRHRARDLSARLDRWDPIGVYAEDGPPPGEYDCMVSATMRALQQGDSAPKIAEMLARELVEHFGLEPAPPPLAFAQELRVWWDSNDAEP